MTTKYQVRARKQREEKRTMATHKTGTREQWLKARLELLKAEKELTRRSDEVAQREKGIEYNYRREAHLRTLGGKGPICRARRLMGQRRSRLCAERTRRRTSAKGRA